MNAVTYPLVTDRALREREAREKALGLRDLRYFLSVAQTGNLGRAARELNVSQPAISLQLRKLEEGLGTQLLLRHGRGVSLTPAGARLRDRLHTVMGLLASPLDEEAPEPAARTISLAVPAEAAGPLLGPLARAFRARWPHARLEVREGDGTDLEEWLLHRHVDLAVLQDPPSLPDIEVTPILTEALGLIAPVHAAVVDHEGPLSLRELSADSLILPGPRHWMRRRIDSAAQQSGIRLSPVLQVSSVALAKVMVRSGLGYAILPRSAAQDEIARGTLGFRHIGQPPITCTRVVAFHRAASNTSVAAFASMTCDAMAAMAEGGAWPQARILRQPQQPGSWNADSSWGITEEEHDPLAA